MPPSPLDSYSIIILLLHQYTLASVMHFSALATNQLYYSSTFQPALMNMSNWLQGLSGLVMTSPGPMTLNVASMCMGFGSLNES